MEITFIDIHAHVNFAAFEGDRDEVIKKTLEEGVAFINVGTQKDTSEKAVRIAEQYEKGAYAIVGVHPIHSDKSHHDLKELGEGGKEFTSRGEACDHDFYLELAKNPKVVGIGECGLDYYRLSPETEQKQIENFEKQIAIANEVGKPLMLHVRSGSGRSAYREALKILKAKAKVRGNFHFFAGSLEEAREIVDAGYTLSFTGVITFARDYDEVIKNVPLQSIMSETDAPYVTPVPFRGKRNEPKFVKEVVKKIAQIRGEDEEVVRSAILKNAEDFFGIKL